MMHEHHISIGICTYRRPVLLDNLLAKVITQNAGGLFDFSIVVVDNDVLQSGKLIIDQFKLKSKVEISYFNIPEQNISLARNEVIRNAKGNYIALIDDDELPGDNWLLELYNAINKYESDGILGPVIPHFNEQPPHWILKGEIFKRKSYPSGKILDWKYTRTGNALLKMSVFKKNEIWFDPKFGSGGEDRDFFKRKINEGFVFVWSNEAKVYETIPPHRWKQSILLKRALLRGKAISQKSNNIIKEVVVSIIAIIIYSISLPMLILIGYHLFFKYLVKICDHLGKILSILGFDLIKEKYIS